MTWLKKIFESRFAGIICFLFAIINRIIFATLYSFIGNDSKLQIIYAENFLAGKGMGTIKYFANDLNNPVFDTQQYSPPGFSFMIIPFLKLFGDEYKAMLAYDILVAVLLVIAVRILGKKAGLSSPLNNIITLIAGCSQYLFFTSWSPTDAICVCLTLFALAEIICIINKERVGWLRVLSGSLLFCSPFFFRYMYLPVTILLPSFLVFYSFYIKNKELKKSGIRIFVATASCLALFFTISLLMAGNTLYMVNDEINSERGLFVSQFELCYPFLPASFINIDFGAQLIQNTFGPDYSLTIFYLKIINAAFFIVLLILLFRFINAQRKIARHANHSLFIIIGSLVSITIIFLLTWLSVTYKEYEEQDWGFYKWAYFQEGRYFAFLNVFIPLLLFICLHHYRTSFKKPLLRFFAIIALSCLFIETLHGVYYNIKILLHHKDLAYIRNADLNFRSYPAILTEIQKQNPDRELIVCSPDNFSLYTASQMGYKAIFDYLNFLHTDVKVSSKTILVMPVLNRDVIYIKDFMEKRTPHLAYTIGDMSIYTMEINPG